MQKTDYSKIANTYNKRYSANYLVNIEKEIKNIIASNNYNYVLEAGCGTGRWISAIEDGSKKVFGLDYSFDMMKIPKTEKSYLNLINADAVKIPVKDNFFDLIFCVNAIHHFPEKQKFISECNRTLKSNGMLAVFGVDPHIDKDWYVYNYFNSVYENDLKRFPSLELLQKLLEDEKFVDIKIKIIEKVHHEKIGNEVLNDPFLNKHHCSQLANLSDDEYQKGINKIKNQIKKNPNTVFKTSVIFYLVSAKKIKGTKMPIVIKSPTIIEAAGNKPKIIEEYFGRVNSKTEAVSIAKMTSPQGWVEPGQRPEFDEYTVVLKGILQVKTENDIIDVKAGSAILTKKGEWIQYSTPYEGTVEYIAVCLPAFSPETVNRDE